MAKETGNQSARQNVWQNQSVMRRWKYMIGLEIIISNIFVRDEDIKWCFDGWGWEDVYIFLYLRKAHCSPLSDTSYRNSSLQYTTINLDLKPLATQKISQIWLFCVREILSSLQDIWSAERKVIDFVSIFGPFLHSLHFEQLFIHFFLQSFDRDVGLCETW